MGIVIIEGLPLIQDPDVVYPKTVWYSKPAPDFNLDEPHGPIVVTNMEDDNEKDPRDSLGKSDLDD